MKTFIQKAVLVLSLEKDSAKNLTGMQTRVWTLNNKTTIVIRLFQHDSFAKEKLWNGRRNNGEVCEFMLKLLFEWGMIKNPDHWEYSVDVANNIEEQDEFEEKQECIYFSWNVKEELLDF